MPLIRFQKYSTFAQRYCQSKYKHPVVVVEEMTPVKVNGRLRKLTTAECKRCGYFFITTHARIKKLLKGHREYE